MSEELLIRHCSPTLAGLKSGSQFSCKYTSKRQVLSQSRRLNRILVPKGLSLLPLRYSGGRVLIYLYRPASLRRDLGDSQAHELLDKEGYSGLSPEKCIAELRRRLNSGGEFPHEIGLFLSYPPEDVRGFIECGGRECKCVGCWKVYGDEKAARCRFQQYRKCTSIYERAYKNGCALESLAVADSDGRGMNPAN